MPRIPRAARQLARELTAVIPNVSHNGGDLDGFGVYRTVSFDGNGVEQVLESISHDPRIISVNGNTVHFVTGQLADNPRPFSVAAVAAVLAAPEPTLAERLDGMKAAEIREEFGFESGVTKKDMIAEILNDAEEPSDD